METRNPEKRAMMFKLIESWKVSQQTKMEFCRIQNISYHDFIYWFKRYSQLASKGEVDFVPLQIHPAVSDSPTVELELPNGRKLRLFQKVDAHLIKLLLS